MRDLWCVPTTASNAYLWRGPSGALVVIDPGLYGDESIVLTAIDDIGAHQRDVETIVVTHFHSDHAGAAQALADGTGARVCAGADAAAVLRGECCLAEVPLSKTRQRPSQASGPTR